MKQIISLEQYIKLGGLVFNIPLNKVKFNQSKHNKGKLVGLGLSPDKNIFIVKQEGHEPFKLSGIFMDLEVTLTLTDNYKVI